MNALFEVEATITERGQTTVPSAIRKALGVGRQGKVVFRQMDDGSIVIAPKSAGRETDDPVMATFLQFLARDMQARPDAIAAFPPSLAKRTAGLTRGAKFDAEAPIEGDVTL